MRTRVVFAAVSKSPSADVWAWGLTNPDGTGFERVDITNVGGLETLDLGADDVTFGVVLFTVPVRESAVDGG